MAKFHGVISGKGSGKLGNVVLRIRSGQQIVATYNPIVANPKSKGQTDQRAKFKLMTQLAAVMDFALALPRTIGGTMRNTFVSYNYPLTDISDFEGKDVAVIPLDEIQLTKSTSPFVGELAAELSSEGNVKTLTVQTRNADDVYDFVQYAVFELTADTTSTLGVTVRPARVGRSSRVSKDETNYAESIENFVIDASSRLLILAFGMTAKDGVDSSFGNTGNDAGVAYLPIETRDIISSFDLTMTTGLIISQ